MRNKRTGVYFAKNRMDAERIGPIGVLKDRHVLQCLPAQHFLPIQAQD